MGKKRQVNLTGRVKRFLMVHLTFEEECLVPVWIEVLPFDLGLQFVLLVRQQVEFDKRVGGSGKILGR